MPPVSANWIHQRLNRALGQLREGRLIRARKLVDEVLERVPDHVGALRLAGDVARADGQLEFALKRYIAAAKQDPSHLSTLDAINQVAGALDRTDRATQALELAVLADPSDGKRQLRLGQGYFTGAKLQEALGHAQLANMLQPDDPAVLGLLGVVQLHLEDRPAALAALHRAIELDPTDAQAMVNAAVGLEEMGDTVAARALQERAGRLAPDDPLVAFHTKELTIATADDPRIAALEARLEDPLLTVEGRALAGLSLAKLWDDAGDTARAAAHLRTANAVRADQLERRGRRYDAERDAAVAAALLKAFDRQILDRAHNPKAGPVPIVLVGLPRAGKTLLEARLGADPSLVTMGERLIATSLRHALEQRLGEPFPRGLERVDGEDAAALSEMLLSELASIDRAPEAAAFITAIPGNELVAGLYVLADARTVVVHCQRDPGDLLLANYLQWFPNRHEYAFEPDALVARFQVLEQLVGHWEDALGSRFLRVRYEDLVDDPATVVAAVRDAAGLPLFEGEYARATAERVAASPTAKPDPDAPLHRAHVGVWARWEPHLPELATAIRTAGLRERYAGHDG